MGIKLIAATLFSIATVFAVGVQSQVIDFEDHSAGTTITAEYSSRGVIFANAYLDSDLHAHSGTRVLRVTSLATEVFTAIPLVMTFPNAVKHVAFFAGNIPNVAGSGTLRVFDSNNSLLATVGPKAVPNNAFTAFFEVKDPTGRIVRAEFLIEGSAWASIDDLVVDGNVGTLLKCPSGVGDPSQVTAISLLDVDAQAIPERVAKRTAFSDLCRLCEEQTLEAIVPTPGLPRRYEADGGLPYRRKFCGTVTRYGVNDELDAPRDIMINILPAPLDEYQQFVAGFVNTEDTPLCDNEKILFQPSSIFPIFHSFNAGLCVQTAKNRYGRVIHAEVTPDEHFFGKDRRFLPISNSGRCGETWYCQSELEPPNGGSINQNCGSPQAPVAQGDEVCVYGVYALDHGPDHSADSHKQFCSSKDASHDRPEIHPFDAVWWRHPDSKGWMFGVFQDDSNRYSKPYGGDTNSNGWSQGPRDLILRFPFRFPLQAAPMQACLRHVRAPAFGSDVATAVSPMNITTGEVVDLRTQVTALTINGKRLLSVEKEAGSERETYVVVVGRVVGSEVVGQIMLRVAVGAGPNVNAKPLFNRLQQENPLVIYDKNDKGAGYYYGELTFECACSR